MISQNNLTLYRPGTNADSYAVFTVFERTLADLMQRMGSNTTTSYGDPGALAQMWEERQPLYSHLARTADQFWIAERKHQIVGFSRSIVRGNLRELTELFVLPEHQSGSIGRELINRTFPSDEIKNRSIIATTDLRAQALYLKSGVYPRFPIYYFGRQPEDVSVSTDLSFKPIEEAPKKLDILGKLDKMLLGHRRDIDHTWLTNDRQGYIYFREDRPVGYGYLGIRNGPFALLDPSDFPAVLAHAESQAAANQLEQFGVEVPMVNHVVVDHLLKRGFHLDTFMGVMMTNHSFGKFENYILTSPPFLL